MKKATWIGIFIAVLLLVVLLLAACQPKPTAEPETPGDQTPDKQTEDISEAPAGESGDNDVEWQDSWGDSPNL